MIPTVYIHKIDWSWERVVCKNWKGPLKMWVWQTTPRYEILQFFWPTCQLSIKSQILKRYRNFVIQKSYEGRAFLPIPFSLRHATLLKERLWHRCFPVNFVKFPRTCFLQNTSRRLLLELEKVKSLNFTFSKFNYDIIFIL